MIINVNVNLLLILSRLHRGRIETRARKILDQEGVGGWAKEVVAICSKNSLIIGNEKSEFNPKDNMTKAELATIIMRMLEQAETYIN